MPDASTIISSETRPVTGARQGVTDLEVTGMTCANCARHVTEAIQSVPGVHSATVNLESHRASVRWAAGAEQNAPAVLRAIKAEGYGARAIEGHGHDHSPRTLAGWQLNLWVGLGGTIPLLLGEWVFAWGMAPWYRWSSLALAAIVQVVAGAPFYRGAWNQLKAGGSNMDTLVALGSTTAFGYSAWALLSGQGGHLYFMEAAAIITLISMGHWMEARVSARASSALRRLLDLTPPTARKLVSTRADVGVASAAPAAPRQASAPSSPLDLRRFRPVASVGTVEVDVAMAELKIGDLVVLRPGDRVPTDGEAAEGESAVDEAMLTGESVPVDKRAGSRLYGGTVNLDGRLVMRVTAVGEETALAHIIAAVQRAQSSRANIQRIGDRVSSVFVPLVVLLALAAGLWWGFAPESALRIHGVLAPFLWPAHPPAGAAAAFIVAAAVLIIACPCAMGLATPAAIMAGSNAAARRGILVRDGVALEKAGQVTAILFDKTGTLTAGKPEVAKLWEASAGGSAAAGWRTEFPGLKAATLAAALARHSKHPLSQAVARLSPDDTRLSGWQEIRGAGVQANLERSTLNSQPSTRLARLGSLSWLRDEGVDLAPADGFVAEWSAQGASLVGLAVDKSLLAIIAVRDILKPGAAGVVGRLQRQGLKAYLVTGDHASTAASIAQQAGIKPENVFAAVRPGRKAELVKQLQEQGERVAFVGDGINDAPALEQADLGIAVSRASDIAREAADIILLNSEIEAIPESLALARATLRTIHQNLFWAFFYNAAGVPLAALGFMSPVLCAAAMGVSDLIVIGNALRLRSRNFQGKH